MDQRADRASRRRISCAQNRQWIRRLRVGSFSPITSRKSANLVPRPTKPDVKNAGGLIGTWRNAPLMITYLGAPVGACVTFSRMPSSSNNRTICAVPLKLCGPHSSKYPSRRSERIAPPARSEASTSSTSTPAFCNEYAQTRPETPPPTTSAATRSLTPQAAVSACQSVFEKRGLAASCCFSR